MTRPARATTRAGMIAALAFATTAIGIGLQSTNPETLQRLMELEQADEVRLLPAVVAKPQVIANWAPPPDDPLKAASSEADLRTTLASAVPSKSPQVSVSEADRERALRLLEEATKSIREGSLGEATRLYRESLRLNPGSAEAWSGFAQLLANQANPIGAKSAYTEAVSLGQRDFDTLLGFGLLSAEFREDDAAIVTLSEASLLGTEDMGAKFVLAHTLAEVLARQGYLSAAVQRYIQVLDLPETFTQATNYRTRLNEVYRKQRSVMMDAAEASHSIGDWQSLERFLNAAASIPGPPDPRETAIRCYVFISTQRPAHAAELLLSDFDAQTATPDRIALLGYLAGHSDLDAQLDRIISDRVAEMSEEARETARQSILLARAAVASDADRRHEILLSHLNVYPTDRAVWLELLREDAVTTVRRLLNTHPALEPDLNAVVLRLHGPIEAERETALSIRSMMRQGEFSAAVNAFLESQPVPAPNEKVSMEIDFSMLTLGVELLVDSIEGVTADRLLDAAIQQATTPPAKLATARGLLERGRFREALSLLDQVRESPQLSDGDFILTQRIAIAAELALGDEAKAIALARQALQHNPGDFDAAVTLSQYSTDDEAEQLLRNISGAQAELDLLRARIALQRDQFDLAERLVRSAWESPLRPGDTAERLVSLWVRTGAIDTAEQWLVGAVSEFPDRPDLAALLASLLRSDRRPEDALQVILDARTIRQGSTVISLALESLLREDFEATDRWLSAARSRLANAPSTYASFAERAEVELVAGNIDRCIALIELAADLAPQMRPGEQATTNALLEGVSREIISRPRVSPETVVSFRRVFERLDTPSEDAWRGRISVASIDRESTEDDLVRLAITAGEGLPHFREQAFIHAAKAIIIASQTGQSLFERNEARQAAVTVYTEATRRLEPFPSEVLGAWIDYTQQIQDPFALGEAIRSLGDRTGPQDRRLVEALNYLLMRGTSRDDGRASTEMLTEGASYLASQLALNEQFDTARVLYEEILRLDPDHVETNNSYGYRLLEAREQTDRAIRMIELAYGLAPNEAHITDSMGWARYLQGRLTDEVDPRTGMVRPGAVSLLRRARTLSLEADPIGLNSCYTVDHLGDALWAVGERDQAVEAWTEAVVHATRASAGIRGTPLPLSIEVELEQLIEKLSEKIRAAGEDRQPEIAAPLD